MMFAGIEICSCCGKPKRPKNVAHPNPECAAALLDEQSGERKTGGPGVTRAENISRKWGGLKGTFASVGYEDTATGASRFFYCSKASKRDRDEGLEGMPEPKYKLREDLTPEQREHVMAELQRLGVA